eukprot:m.17817 g.17817  ORF g.17817 m.17817 type:complete len:123 (+) comp29653_c0_seq1:12-380(+)
MELSAVTVRQLRAPQQTLVELVGQVTKIQRGFMYTWYTLDDFTGVIECELWPHDEHDSRNSIPLGAYVKVVGRVQCADQVNSVHILSIAPLDNPNSITLHLLDVIMTHCASTRRAQQLSDMF